MAFLISNLELYFKLSLELSLSHVWEIDESRILQKQIKEFKTLLPCLFKILTTVLERFFCFLIESGCKCNTYILTSKK